MRLRRLEQVIKAALFILLTATLLGAYAAQAQSHQGFTCEGLWQHVNAGGEVIFEETNKWFYNSCTRGEEEEEEYDDGGLPTAQKQQPRPPVVTCPSLPPSVVVFGYVEGTQCQIVDAAGVGNMDVIKRGFINAVDIWSYVNGGIEVCFRYTGALLFLDANYAPRMLSELASFQRDHMTCGAINGPGTVVLVQASPPSAPAVLATPPPPGEPTLPAIDDVPQSHCQIKLQETLFLRAAPAGEIIGLVWLYSEVPVFETIGDWYKVEFEGKIGYISRFYRKVLRGGCA